MSLKTRVIPILLHRGDGLVKSVRFSDYRVVGSPIQSVRVFSARKVDELVFLDIDATPSGRPPRLDLIREIADDCFMPLAVGGGVRSVDDVRDVLCAGADKVVLGTAGIRYPALISDIAGRFGAQCVVAAIDARTVASTDSDAKPRWEILSECGRQAVSRDAVEWAIECERRGAGELLVTNVDRDGTMSGYDLDLIRAISEAVSVPVIAAGGAGEAKDLALAALAGASAVSAASIFYFTQIRPLSCKQEMAKAGIEVRI